MDGLVIGVEIVIVSCWYLLTATAWLWLWLLRNAGFAYRYRWGGFDRFVR